MPGYDRYHLVVITLRSLAMDLIIFDDWSFMFTLAIFIEILDFRLLSCILSESLLLQNIFGNDEIPVVLLIRLRDES